MAKVTFYGDIRLIAVNDGDENHDLDAAIDLYSDWKEWMLEGDNAKYVPAFRTIGGDPLGSGLSAGAYFFLQNHEGWRIRPHGDSHELTITGNLYSEDATLPMFVPPIGGHTIAIKMERSSLTQRASGETATAIAAAVIAEPVGASPRAGSLGDYLAQILTKVNGLPSGVPRNVALAGFKFVLLSASDHVTPITGRTVTAARLTVGDSGPLANSVVEVGSGVYQVDLTAAELYDRANVFLFTASGADPQIITVVTSG
jgi:hypothetical protein